MSNRSASARFWDRSARKYAADPIRDPAGYERTIARTREWLEPSHTVIEIGCGTGTSALRLAPSVARVIGTDISTEMIAIARERATDANCPNASFEVGSADEPVPAAEPGDAVLAFNLLHLVPDRHVVLDRIRQALKPGGLFISKTPCLAEMNPLIRLAIPVMQVIGKAPYVASFTAMQLENDVVAAGFSIEERGRHGSGKRDPRLFIVARRPLGQQVG